jgi:hypothetical protein
MTNEMDAVCEYTGAKMNINRVLIVSGLASQVIKT